MDEIDCYNRNCRFTTIDVEKACSADNSACEGFFGRMKVEMFYGRSWVGVLQDELIDRINAYMKWYREQRLKLSLWVV